jgi:hypothetical protein
MLRYLPMFAALASSLIPSLKADESDNKANITVSKPFGVGATVFSTGHYVPRLQNSSSNRDVVRIFDEDGTPVITSILATPASRLEPAGRPRLSFLETPAEQPAALHTWFFAGDTNGVEYRRYVHFPLRRLLGKHEFR